LTLPLRLKIRMDTGFSAFFGCQLLRFETGAAAFDRLNRTIAEASGVRKRNLVELDAFALR
jgi:hypothetical protein